MKSFKQLTQQIIREQQLMRQEMVHLKQSMAQQAKLQNQLGTRVSCLTATVHAANKHQDQHYISLPRNLIPKSLQTRMEAIRDMPFLSDYPILDCTQPFVVDDIQKPTAALVKMDKAIYVYVNQAFCSLLKYSQVITPTAINLLLGLFCKAINA